MFGACGDASFYSHYLTPKVSFQGAFNVLAIEPVTSPVVLMARLRLLLFLASKWPPEARDG